MSYKFRPTKPFELHQEAEGRFNKDSEFLDGIVAEHIDVGGVPIYVYRYRGTYDQDRDPLGLMTPLVSGGDDLGSFVPFQDTILGENRDRDYDIDDVPRLKAVYQVGQNELEYAKFGLTGLAGNVLTLELHLQTCETMLGRRLIPGDIIQMPHLREVGVDGRVADAWYEVASVVKSPGGWDAMYAFHVLGVIIRPMRDAQEFITILEQKDQYGKTLADQASNRNAMLEMTAKNQQIAEAQAPTVMYDLSRMYIDPTDGRIKPEFYFDDGKPPNGIAPVGSGSGFPTNPADGDYFLRTNLDPNRLYRFERGRWRVKEIDHKREWQPYNWTAKLREYMSDRSEADNARKYKLKGIHDTLTDREDNSDPTYSNEKP